METPSTLTRRQVKKYGPVFYTENGTDYKITAKVRYDDECGNGHNSFAITADIKRMEHGFWREDSGGCCHEEVAKHFPELAPFIKWHLCSSDGPMHYVANTVYHASQRDCWGKLKGEVKSYKKAIQFKGFPILYRGPEKFIEWVTQNRFNLQVEKIEHKKDGYFEFDPKYSFKGYCTEWHECPFDTEKEANEFLCAMVEFETDIIQIPDSFGVGKARDLDAARSCACWPEATDAELCADNLEERLLARLPALLAAFRKDIESLGFTW